VPRGSHQAPGRNLRLMVLESRELAAANSPTRGLDPGFRTRYRDAWFFVFLRQGATQYRAIGRTRPRPFFDAGGTQYFHSSITALFIARRTAGACLSGKQLFSTLSRYSDHALDTRIAAAERKESGSRIICRQPPSTAKPGPPDLDTKLDRGQSLKSPLRESAPQ